MLTVVLGAGIGLVVIGLAALGYGIPYKEFGLGNTLIGAGTVAACSGLLMLGLWTVAREVQLLAHRLGAGAATAVRPQPPAEPALAPGLPPSLAAPEPATAADPAAAPPWGEERGGRESPPLPATEESPPPRQRRNLLFTSSSRKERERAAARASEPLAPDLLSADLRPNPPEAPPAEALPPPPANFDDAWPRADRGKPGEAPPRRNPRAPSTFSESGGAVAAREDAPQVTVLKSGVVDGMAYSLYSDGSIEAQMPEGMMRFASIDELRSHLDQRP